MPGVQKGVVPSGEWEIGDYSASIPYAKTKWRPVGELDGAPWTFNTESAAIASSSSLTGGNAEIYTQFKEGKLELRFKQFPVENLALMLGASLTAVTTTPIVGEVHAVHKDSFVPTDYLIDITVDPVLKKGVTVIDTDDYTYDQHGFYFKDTLTTAGLVEDDDFTADYTPLAGYDLEALVDLTKEYRLNFRGKARNSGKNTKANVWRCKPGLVQGLETASPKAEYITGSITFDILEDPLITETGMSKFLHIHDQKMS